MRGYMNIGLHYHPATPLKRPAPSEPESPAPGLGKHRNGRAAPVKPLLRAARKRSRQNRKAARQN